MTITTPAANRDTVETIEVTHEGLLNFKIQGSTKPSYFTMSKAEMIDLKRSIEKALKPQPSVVNDENLESLVRTFLFSKPYLLNYEYRKENFKRDKSLLDKLLKDKRIVQVDKDYTHVLYRYIGEIPVSKK